MEDLAGWPWQPNLCPADDDLIDWLNYQVAQNKAVGPVFHMGTGLHHKVGIECVELGLDCVGLTASEEEFNSFNNEVAYQPGSGNYALVFCNIYDLSPGILGNFQYMTLFHLGEMVYRFGYINYEAIDGLISKVVPGGQVLFYTGSSAWDRSFVYMKDAIDRMLLIPQGLHRSLAVCLKT